MIEAGAGWEQNVWLQGVCVVCIPRTHARPDMLWYMPDVVMRQCLDFGFQAFHASLSRGLGFVCSENLVVLSALQLARTGATHVSRIFTVLMTMLTI